MAWAAAAYRAVSGGMEGLFAPTVNDGDAAKIFDRAADRVCGGCPRREQCWQRDYQTTRTALSDALPRLLDRGEGKGEGLVTFYSSHA